MYFKDREHQYEFGGGAGLKGKSSRLVSVSDRRAGSVRYPQLLLRPAPGGRPRLRPGEQRPPLPPDFAPQTGDCAVALQDSDNPHPGFSPPPTGQGRPTPASSPKTGSPHALLPRTGKPPEPARRCWGRGRSWDATQLVLSGPGRATRCEHASAERKPRPALQSARSGAGVPGGAGTRGGRGLELRPRPTHARSAPPPVPRLRPPTPRTRVPRRPIPTPPLGQRAGSRAPTQHGARREPT